VQREDWDRRYAETELLWSGRPNRVLIEETAALEPGRALDLACGEGQNALWLAQHGWRVTGVDYSSVAIAKARDRAEREGVEIELICSDLLEYEPEDAAFDLVIVFFLHVPTAERRRVLAGAASALTPGGTILLLGHDLTNMTDGVGGPSNPSVLYTPDDIVTDLSGFEIERAERVLRDVVDAERPAIDALVRARRPERS
jgi:SAM-dependent methyltransferase